MSEQAVCLFCKEPLELSVAQSLYKYCLTHRCVRVGARLTPFAGEHLKGSDPKCYVCKTFNESKQITPETLQSGFKAASGKASFDLLPSSAISKMMNDILLEDGNEKYVKLVNSLLIFWAKDDLLSIEVLRIAFEESLRLLENQTGSKISAAFAIGELYAIGAKKYSKRNWEKGIDWGIVWSAAMRHLLNHIKGELHDPIDGQLHLTSVCWNIIALLHFVEFPDKYKQLDSRKDIVVAQNKGQK